MLINLADWLLDIDVDLTMTISAAQAKEHCTCGYCRNYYIGLDRSYPSVRPFLAKFGLVAEAPDELCPFEPTIFEASYIVQGNIVRKGVQQLRIDEVPLTIRTSDEADIYTEHPKPYFVLQIGLLELPWVLSEPMSEVISPANEEEFLDRMHKKLLQRTSDLTIPS